jgi:hypothetical protein
MEFCSNSSVMEMLYLNYCCGVVKVTLKCLYVSVLFTKFRNDYFSDSVHGTERNARI